MVSRNLQKFKMTIRLGKEENRLNAVNMAIGAGLKLLIRLDFHITTMYTVHREQPKKEETCWRKIVSRITKYRQTEQTNFQLQN